MKKNFFLLIFSLIFISINGQECGEIFTDPRDGNQYKTIQICNKCWMKENLRYLPLVYPPSDISDVKPYYYVYDYNGYDFNYAKTTANYKNYGVLYNWTAASNGHSSDLNPSGVQGACPKGWHLPSKGEWSEVDHLLGGSNISGGKLKEIGTTHWLAPNTNATDERNFTALPGGRLDPLTLFQSINRNGYFWTASVGDNQPVYFFMYYLDGKLYSNQVDKKYGYSVRCVRDEPVVVQFPIINLIDITNITPNSANASWSVSPNNSDFITATGIVWSTTPNPTLASNSMVAGTGYGNFSAQISGLSVGTTYYVRAYATNCEGTFYSNERVFTTIGCCGTPFYDPRDNEQYTTVAIGTQCWMKQNLRYLPSVNNISQCSNDVPMYYVYNYNGNNVTQAKSSPNYPLHGVLYNWPAAMGGTITSIEDNPLLHRGVCPIGWHVPNDLEWKEMELLLGIPETDIDLGFPYFRGSAQNVGSKLKFYDPIWNGTNSSNFSALPSGSINVTYSSGLINFETNFWTASTCLNPPTRAYKRLMITENTGIMRRGDYNAVGLSLRCVRDIDADQGTPSINIQNINNVGVRSATVNGVYNVNGSNVIGWGIIYSTTPSPTLSNGTIVYLSGTQTNFTRDLMNLNPNTTYYVRAFVETLCGVVYSNTLNFTTLQIQCPTPFIDPRDNQQYQTILFGNNCWMKENLRYLPNVYPPSNISDTDPRYLVFGYYGTNVSDAILSSNYQNFGVLYNYSAVITNYSGTPYIYPNNLQGPCPNGWHVSSDLDWIELELLMGMPSNEQYWTFNIYRAQNIGSKLAGNPTMWPDGELKNNLFFGHSNFNILPSMHSRFQDFESYPLAFFWISNFVGEEIIYNNIGIKNVDYGSNGIFRARPYMYSHPSMSIRCVKN